MWEGNVQQMVINVGVPKGLIQVLKERGRYRKLYEMTAEISGHPDFKNKKTKIEHFLNGKGYGCIFLNSIVTDRAMLGAGEALHTCSL